MSAQVTTQVASSSYDSSCLFCDFQVYKNKADGSSYLLKLSVKVIMMTQWSLWFGIFCFALLVVLVGALVIYYSCKQEIVDALERKKARTSIIPVDFDCPMSIVNVKQIHLCKNNKVTTLKKAKVEDFNWTRCDVLIGDFGLTVFEAWCFFEDKSTVLLRPYKMCRNFEFEKLFGFGSDCRGFTRKRIIRVILSEPE